MRIGGQGAQFPSRQGASLGVKISPQQDPVGGCKQCGGPLTSQLLSECKCFSLHSPDPRGGGGSAEGEAGEPSDSISISSAPYVNSPKICPPSADHLWTVPQFLTQFPRNCPLHFRL